MAMLDDDEERRRVIRIDLSDPSLLLIPACAASFGFVSGLLGAGKRSSLQFLAENAHRQPTTLQGWYFYNKTKNYRVALGAAKGGLLTAAKLGAWTSSFVLVKEGATRLGLGRIESGGLSGLTLAVFAGTLYKLPRRTLPKRLLLGISFGAMTGLLQNARDSLKELKARESSKTAT